MLSVMAMTVIVVVMVAMIMLMGSPLTNGDDVVDNRAEREVCCCNMYWYVLYRYSTAAVCAVCACWCQVQ